MSELQRDLKTIVGIDKLESRIKALEERERIESNRGIAWQDSLGNMSSAATNAASGALAPATALGAGTSALTDAATDAASDAIEDKAKGVHGGDGYKDSIKQEGSVRSGGDGIYGFTDFLDGALSGFDLGDTVLGISDGLWNGVPIEVRTTAASEDGNNTKQTGNATSEAVTNFAQGYKWTGAFAVSSTAPTAYEAAVSASNSFYTVSSFTSNPTGSPHGPGFPDPDRYTVTYYDNRDGLTYTGTVTCSTCSVDAEESCPSTWTEPTWSDEGTLTVYKKANGTFGVASPDIRTTRELPGMLPGDYGPTTFFIQKNVNGSNRILKLMITADGGTIVGEVTAVQGAGSAYITTSRVTVTDSSGKVVAKPLGSEAKVWINRTAPYY